MTGNEFGCLYNFDIWIVVIQQPKHMHKVSRSVSILFNDNQHVQEFWNCSEEFRHKYDLILNSFWIISVSSLSFGQIWLDLPAMLFRLRQMTAVRSGIFLLQFQRAKGGDVMSISNSVSSFGLWLLFILLCCHKLLWYVLIITQRQNFNRNGSGVFTLWPVYINLMIKLCLGDEHYSRLTLNVILYTTYFSLKWHFRLFIEGSRSFNVSWQGI